MKPQDVPVWTEGVCGDGAAILRDGVMMPIEEVVAELNRLTALAAESREPTRKGASKPLWRLMLDAVIDAIPTGSLGHRGFAAELRAIAEEAPKATGLLPLTPRSIDVVVQWLLSEADRAERGEE